MFWTSCSSKGAVKPPLLMDPPDFLKGLLQNTDQQSRQFRASIRQYNAASVFTSMTFNATNRNNDQSGWMSFQIHGELCHLQGPLTPEEGAIGIYSQIYFYDSDYASDIRSRQNSNLDKDTFDKLRDLSNYNQTIFILEIKKKLEIFNIL
jgi:hypothetical protein